MKTCVYLIYEVSTIYKGITVCRVQWCLVRHQIGIMELSHTSPPCNKNVMALVQVLILLLLPIMQVANTLFLQRLLILQPQQLKSLLPLILYARVPVLH